jgi:hypothetical protein
MHLQSVTPLLRPYLPFPVTQKAANQYPDHEWYFFSAQKLVGLKNIDSTLT